MCLCFITGDRPVRVHLTSVHWRIFRHTPPRPSRRTGLWRTRSRNRKCISDRPTSAPARLQSASPRRRSAAKQRTNELQYKHQILISSSLSPTEHLYQFCRNSLNVFLSYRVQNGMDQQTPFKPWLIWAFMKTYQSRGYDQALHGLRFVKQLQLLYDVHFSFDVHGSVQPAVVCRGGHNLVKEDTGTKTQN